MKVACPLGTSMNHQNQPHPHCQDLLASFMHSNGLKHQSEKEKFPPFRILTQYHVLIFIKAKNESKSSLSSLKITPLLANHKDHTVANQATIQIFFNFFPFTKPKWCSKCCFGSLGNAIWKHNHEYTLHHTLYAKLQENNTYREFSWCKEQKGQFRFSIPEAMILIARLSFVGNLFRINCQAKAVTLDGIALNQKCLNILSPVICITLFTCWLSTKSCLYADFVE